jgi:hypothetical protein
MSSFYIYSLLLSTGLPILCAGAKSSVFLGRYIRRLLRSAWLININNGIISVPAFNTLIANPLYNPNSGLGFLAAWRACFPQGNEGSNPSLSARKI